MHEWYIQYSHWQGTAAELADLIQTLLTKVGLDDESVIPNERLVRNYMQLGILDRPERSGKESYFGARQVIEFLVARKLIRDGWPLAKIGEFNRTHELGDLLALFPESRPMTEAEKLVTQLRFESKQLLENSKPMKSATSTSGSPTFLMHSADWSKRKSSARDVLRLLGNTTGQPVRQGLVKLSLTAWCEVLVDLEQLRKLPIESLDELGQTIAQLLREELQSTRRSSS